MKELIHREKMTNSLVKAVATSPTKDSLGQNTIPCWRKIHASSCKTFSFVHISLLFPLYIQFVIAESNVIMFSCFKSFVWGKLSLNFKVSERVIFELLITNILLNNRLAK